MTTFLILLALLTPIAIAWRTPLPPSHDGEPDAARALRTRLIVVALGLAVMTLVCQAIRAGAMTELAGGTAPGFRPEVLAIWIPWVLLARYWTQVRADAGLADPPSEKRSSADRAELGPTATKRFAALRPDSSRRAMHRAWCTVALAWAVMLPIVGWPAWQQVAWTAMLLLAFIPLWLALGYGLSRTGWFRDPQPFASDHPSPHLVDAYARRHSLTAWSTFAIFTVVGLLHTLLAATLVEGSSTSAITLSLGAGVTLIAIGIAHLRLRRQADARIAGLLARSVPP